MKTATFFPMVSACSVVLLSLSLVGCAQSSVNSTSGSYVSTTTINTIANKANAISKSNLTNGNNPDITTTIRNYYAARHGKILHLYREKKGTLVKWNHGDIASQYDWWSLHTGHRTRVPTNTDFTKVALASNSDIRLVATGPNSIGPSLTFPYVIDDYRGSSTQSSFQMTKRPYYLLLSHSVKFGDGKHGVLTSLKSTLDGFEASFGPAAGDEGSFYAGSAGCPTMDTSYDSKTHTLTIRFVDTSISNTVKQSVKNWANKFVTSAAFTKSGSDTLLHVKLKPVSTNYNAGQRYLYEASRKPYVAFHFAGKTNPIYPDMIEEQFLTRRQG